MDGHRSWARSTSSSSNQRGMATVGTGSSKLTGTTGPSPEVVELLAECRHRRIPTVFWNEEILPISTTSFRWPSYSMSSSPAMSDSSPNIKPDWVMIESALLPFAAQPAIHNPSRPHTILPRVTLHLRGCTSHTSSPSAASRSTFSLGAAAAVSGQMQHGLEIFSRFLGEDERYQFPSALAERVVGSLPYQNLLTAYKHFKVFLNVNSVVDFAQYVRPTHFRDHSSRNSGSGRLRAQRQRHSFR